MPGVITEPNLIERSDFSGGYSPDGENATTDANVLLDAMNLLPDLNTHSLTARPGFSRLFTPLLTDGHFIKQMFHMVPGHHGNHFIIAILTNGGSTANNVQIWALEMGTMKALRIDDTGVTWDYPDENHWGISIDKLWYGGSRGNEMYSWNPNTWNGTSDNGAWNATAATGTWKTLVDGVDASIATGTQYGRDFAFNGKEKVFYNSDVYAPDKDIRYQAWNTGENYSKGDRVSRQAAWGHSGTPKYWKSFRCIKAHAAAVGNKPGDGADTATYWQKIRLDLPIDDNGDTAKDWNFVPIAAQTSVATWHANRLWMRYDDQGDKSRVQYSAPVKPEKGTDIPDLEWDPKNFAPATNFNGSGGGWIPFNDGRSGGVVEALRSYGQYLIIFKRREVYALSGSDEATWTNRNIGKGVGTMSARANLEMDGLVYFLSDDGLYVTDGTACQPVPGNDKVRYFLRDRLDASMQQGDQRDPELNAFDGYIFISLPYLGDFLTLVYHPKTESFWPTDLPILGAVTFRQAGIDRLAFSAGPQYGGLTQALIYEYHNGAVTDDAGQAAETDVPVSWRMRTAWWPFGTKHEQRRVRRVWALVKGAVDFTLTAWRNYDDLTSVVDVTRTGSSYNVVEYIEGATFADSHAVSFSLEGASAPASVYGVAVDTQPRRTRYHT